MRKGRLRPALLSLLAGILTLAMFFPILWMVLTSFKTEAAAFEFPPRFFFMPTLANWRIALIETPFLPHLVNTLLITGLSVCASLLLGVPAAYALAFGRVKRREFILLWMMSTRMLPPVGVIVALYVVFRDLGLLDAHLGLVLVFTAMNLPLAVWMMTSFLQDVPFEALEAARIDGATLLQEVRYVVLPMVRPGLVTTSLLCFIFAWNEFFFAFNLTVTEAAPLSVYLASFKTAEGLFWAKMSAAATAAVLPVVVAGWAAQRQLVQGLTMGAVK
jgi:sorbitol/mannitol transport system permease protein